jgi:hypothetical protein
MPTFQKVELHKKQDLLDGIPLKNDEKVIVRWGDGTSSSHRIVMEKEGAFLKLAHKGIELKLPLRNSNLFMVRDV